MKSVTFASGQRKTQPIAPRYLTKQICQTIKDYERKNSSRTNCEGHCGGSYRLPDRTGHNQLHGPWPYLTEKG